MNNKNIAVELKTVGNSLLIFLVSMFFISLAFWVFNLFPATLIFLLSIGSGLTYILYRGKSEWGKIIQIAVFLAVIGFSIIANIFIYDFSWDGQSYHREAIIQLADGWNPIYEEIREPYIWDFTLKHYPKFSWISGAVIFKTTGYIENSKSINLILVFAAFFIVYAFFKEHFSFRNKLLSFLLTLVLVLNPVTVYQMFTGMVDGNMSICLLLLITSLIALFHKYKWVYLLTAGLSILILINLKFTGLAFAFILIAFYFIYLFIYKIETRAKQTVFLSLFVFSGLIGGVNPYLNNISNYGHIFHPINEKSVITGLEPHAFKDMSHAQKTIAGIFAVSDGTNWQHNVKIPFSIKKRELFAFYADGRQGGWGPLFSGVLLFSILTLIPLYYSNPKHFKWLVLISLPIILTFLIFPENWWARLIPHFYFVPFIFIILTIGYTTKNYLGKVALGLILILTLNIAFVFASYSYNQFIRQYYWEREMHEIAAHKEVYVYFDNGYFRNSIIRKLSERSIDYIVVEDSNLVNAHLTGTFESVFVGIQKDQ